MELRSNFELLKVSWLESLTLFRPATFKLFLLVTLKALKELYSTMVHAVVSFFSSRVVVGLLIVGCLLALPIVLKRGGTPREASTFFINAFLVSFLVQGTRPSLEYKNKRYWSEYMEIPFKLFAGTFFLFYVPYQYLHAKLVNLISWLWATFSLWLPIGNKYRDRAVMVIKLLLMMILGLGIYSVIFNYMPIHSGTSFVRTLYTWFLRLLFIDEKNLGTIVGTLIYFLSPLVIVWALFMFDAQKKAHEYLRALVRAFTMILYNYPFFLISYTFFSLFVILLYMVASKIFPVWPLWIWLGWVSFLGILIPFYICFVTNFYIKRIHEQFSLYYN